jgi:hypothetical protein
MWRIFLRHAHDQLRDLTHHARLARTTPVGKAPLLRDQAPMPPQQGIRRDYGVEFKQGFAPYRLGLALTRRFNTGRGGHARVDLSDDIMAGIERFCLRISNSRH